jgi:hypothetical protein
MILSLEPSADSPNVLQRVHLVSDPSSVLPPGEVRLECFGSLRQALELGRNERLVVRLGSTDSSHVGVSIMVILSVPSDISCSTLSLDDAQRKELLGTLLKASLVRCERSVWTFDTC